MRYHLFKVLLHDRADLVQEGEQHGNIAVLSGRGDHVQVAVLDVGEGALLRLDKWSLVRTLVIFHVSDQTCRNTLWLISDILSILPMNLSMTVPSISPR